MQGQTQISNILALKSNSAAPGNAHDKTRNQQSNAIPSQNGDAFKRMLEAPGRASSAQVDRNDSAAQQRRNHSIRQDRNAQAQAQAQSQTQAQSQAQERAQRQNTAAERRSDADRGAEPSAPARAASQNHASVNGAKAAGDSAKVGAGNEAEDKLARLESMGPEEVKQYLENLSEGDLKALGDQVESLLGDLRAQLEAGELDPDAEAALRDLLAALDDGASVGEIAQMLETLPVAVLPEGASRFPEAKNLRDLLGGSGAAYLTQLAADVNATQRELSVSFKAGGSESTLSSLANILETSQGAELDKLLANSKDLSSSANKENFLKMLQAVSGQEGATARGVELGQNNTSASSLASLDANARTQPLQPSERQFMVQSDVRVPVNQGQWGQAVGQRVLWLAAQNVSSAELRLDPPDLGPMQVRVSSHQDQISVTFTSAQPAVREALDQSATRLREMFAEQGLDLVDVNVSDQSSGEQAAGEEGREGRGGQGGSGDDADPDDGRVSERLIATSLVDHYA